MRWFLLSLTILSLLLGTGLGVRHLWILFYSEELLLPPPTLDFRAARAIFPYSVIPGGVLEGQEVAVSMAHDPVVREHYAGIEPERLWTTRARESMHAYVSYRVGQSVYWTTHPVTIAQGELILTDGVNMIRARCGNRIVLKRPTPLPGSVPEPVLEPPDIVFSLPLPPATPAIIEPPVLPRPVITEMQRPPAPPVGSPVPLGAPVMPGPPPENPLLPPWGPPPNPSPVPLVVVPEPETLLLVGSGLGLLGKFFARKKKSQQ
jgi:hypothetical protein